MSHRVTLRKIVSRVCEVMYNLDERRWDVICEGAFVGAFPTYAKAVAHAQAYEPGPSTEPYSERKKRR